MKSKGFYTALVIFVGLIILSVLYYLLVLSQNDNIFGLVGLEEIEEEKIYLEIEEVSEENEEITTEEEEGYELSYHRSDDPSFFPKPKKLLPLMKRTNFYYGYYSADNIDYESNFVYQPPPFLEEEEDFDCDELNEEHRQLMIERRFIHDINDRLSNNPNATSVDVKFWKLWNDDYFDGKYLFNSFCREKKYRMNLRTKNKTEVKWKEGDPVILFTTSDQWKVLKNYMHTNCTVDFELTNQKTREQDAHIKLYPGLYGRRTEMENYGKHYPDHYRCFFHLESCSQVGYELYLMVVHNYDYVMTYHAMSDVLVYNDWDQEMYLRYSPTTENIRLIQQFYDLKEDENKTYDQLREETIAHIRSVHRSKGHNICTFISHCEEKGGFDRKNLDNMVRSHRKRSNWIRPQLVNLFHQHHKVVNYGSCRGDYKMDAGQEKKTYKSVVSKIFYMNQYPFFLAFENRMIDTYTGAKLMHALLAKYTIPIYYGDPFIEQKFPRELLKNYKVFIDLADFDTISEAVEYIGYLLKNETAYLEYFEWRFDKQYRYLPRTARYGVHDFFDSEGQNVVTWCRLAELFVAERMRYYPEQSRKDKERRN